MSLPQRLRSRCGSEFLELRVPVLIMTRLPLLYSGHLQRSSHVAMMFSVLEKTGAENERVQEEAVWDQFSAEHHIFFIL